MITQANALVAHTAESSGYKSHRITELSELEAERARGPLRAWEALLEADETATFLQGPVWCIEWYRSYRDQFDPLLLYLTNGETLVGLVPLAVEKGTGRVVFAGDNMPDYRDVVAAPNFREKVIGELIRACREVGCQSPLRLGPIRPESATPGLVTGLAGGSSGVRAVIRTHPCWRWWVREGDAEAVKKKSIRQPLKHYRRQGPVEVERIVTSEDWEHFKGEFFDHHSLRQMHVGRPVTFDDPRKREFYTALLKSDPSAVHVSVLRVAGRAVAEHYGFVWDGVLYWGAPSFDIREEQYSPGLILLALIMQNAEGFGLRGIDLTLGIEDYKRRFGNECVQLPTAEIYFDPWRYRVRGLRDRAVGFARSALNGVAGPRSWDALKGAGVVVRGKAAKAREIGPVPTLGRLGRRAGRFAVKRARGLIFTAAAADVNDVSPNLAPGETCQFRRNEIYDMLKWDKAPREVSDEIGAVVRRAPELLRKGHTLHTILINDRLAGWGWSYCPEAPAFLTETETYLDFAENSVSMYDFYVINQYRGRRLYQALLVDILKWRFSEGVEKAYIMCLESNTASHKAIVRAGFKLAAIDDYSRLLWLKNKKRRWV